MEKVIFINEPEKSIEEIQSLIKIVYNGFMALAMDYGYYVKNTFGSAKDGKHEIFELRDSINYRIRSANLHFYLLIDRKFFIEHRFAKMLKDKPTAFNGYHIGNPHFEMATDEVMAIYDSIIFHLSSSFDYLAMLTQFIFGQNPQKNLQWITLVKHCYNKESEYGKRKFVDNIKRVDSEFVSKFNDYRSDLIHRKKSTSFANVSWELKSGHVTTQFECSDKIKSNLKKIINKDLRYCITYASFMVIKETLLKISDVLHGMHDEFRENYNQLPVMNKGELQIFSMSGPNSTPESPSVSYWKKFMEYKKTSANTG